MDRHYVKTGTLFPSLARTTHADSAVEQNDGWTGLRVDLDITAFTGTSITFTIQYYDPGKGDWLTLLASAAQTGTGHVTLHVDPRMTTASNTILAAIVPKKWKLVPSGTITSVTYSASFVYGK